MKKTSLTINREIRYTHVRVVANGSNQVLPINDALAMADAQNLDLVMINNEIDPPICNIVDVGKFKYAQAQKEKSVAKAQRASRITIKEVQFKPNISDHDFDTKCRQISKFAADGNTIKVQVQFRGRERQHTDIGFEIINRVILAVPGIVLDGKIQHAGNRITAIIKGS
jgi:translation initiation factor IF-3